MPIGELSFADGSSMSAASLRERYSELIKQAILIAAPNLEVTRADEVPSAGAITADVFTRLLFSDLVVADITYPNPNVFYELGLRHATRSGTVLIRDTSGPPPPFDISLLRHISYEYTPGGLKRLSEELTKVFSWFESNPTEPDNEYQQLAKLMKFSFPQYQPGNSVDEVMIDMISNPNVLKVAINAQQSGGNIDQGQLIDALATDPELLGKMLRAMHSAGQLKLN
jgi:hypothetical protein